jgi:hypothetical protein
VQSFLQQQQLNAAMPQQNHILNLNTYDNMSSG